jgi:hypothetical protein
MKKLIPIIAGLASVLACALVPTSSATSHRHTSGQCYMSVSAPRGANVYTSTCTVPSPASANASMQIDSAIPASCWADTRAQFECGRIGVIAVVQLPANGHMVMQVASSRWTTTQVQLMVTWG